MRLDMGEGMGTEPGDVGGPVGGTQLALEAHSLSFVVKSHGAKVRPHVHPRLSLTGRHSCRTDKS